jgi:RNA polymerase sporulation-specific sigma factor
MAPRAVKDFAHPLSAAQSGSTDAVDAIVKQYLPLINKLAFKFGGGRDYVPDLIQTGVVSLLDARQRFDPSQHTRFGTYAYHYIRGAMLNYLKSELAHGGISNYENIVCLDAPLAGSEDETATLHDIIGDKSSETTLVNGIDRNRRIARLRPAIHRLTPREQTAVRIVFFRNVSQRQAALLLTVSEPRVSVLLKNSLRKLETYMA